MRSKKDIDYVYKQNLEESIIEYLSIWKNLLLNIYQKKRNWN